MTFTRELIARCGAYCGGCEWKDRMHCPGCLSCAGKPFWGGCAVAVCSIEKGHVYCGECPELPCEKLQAAFDMPGHGDNGERLQNLKNWARGIKTYIRLTKRA